MQTLTYEEVTTLRSIARNTLNTMTELGAQDKVRHDLSSALHKLDIYFSLDGKDVSVDIAKSGAKNFTVTVTHIPTGLSARSSGRSELQCKTIALKRLEQEVYQYQVRAANEAAA